MELLFAALIYSIPLAFLPFVVYGYRPRRHAALSGFFVAPLVGEVALLLQSSGNTVTHPTTSTFWIFVATSYPFALLPIGLWGALLGAMAIAILDEPIRRAKPTGWALLLSGIFLGGFVGLVFVFLCGVVLGLLHGTTEGGGYAWLLAGIAGGSSSGLLTSLLWLKYERRQEDLVVLPS